jgi:hypothetical protein
MFYYLTDSTFSRRPCDAHLQARYPKLWPYNLRYVSGFSIVYSFNSDSLLSNFDTYLLGCSTGNASLIQPNSRSQKQRTEIASAVLVTGVMGGSVHLLLLYHHASMFVHQDSIHQHLCTLQKLRPYAGRYTRFIRLKFLFTEVINISELNDTHC